jgi:hypothetical protein
MNNLNSSNLCVNYAYEIGKDKLDKKNVIVEAGFFGP